jgi:hypothetical protein
MSALDRERAKAQDNQLFYESPSDSDSSPSTNQRSQRWAHARQAWADGTEPSKGRCAVVLAAGGPVRTAREVQHLAGMAGPPATSETSEVALGEGTDKTTEIRRVVICDVSVEEAEKMGEKVEFFKSFHPGTGSMDRTIVLFGGRKEYAMVVKRLLDGVTLAGVDDGAGESGNVK